MSTIVGACLPASNKIDPVYETQITENSTFPKRDCIEDNPIEDLTENEANIKDYERFDINLENSVIDAYRNIKTRDFSFISGLNESWGEDLANNSQDSNLIVVRHQAVAGEVVTLELFPGQSNLKTPTTEELFLTLKRFAAKHLSEKNDSAPFSYSDYMEIVSRYIQEGDVLTAQREDFHSAYSKNITIQGSAALLHEDLPNAPVLTYADRFSFIVTRSEHRMKDESPLLILLNDYDLHKNNFIKPLMECVAKLYKRGKQNLAANQPKTNDNDSAQKKEQAKMNMALKKRAIRRAALQQEANRGKATKVTTIQEQRYKDALEEVRKRSNSPIIFS